MDGRIYRFEIVTVGFNETANFIVAEVVVVVVLEVVVVVVTIVSVSIVGCDAWY